MRPIDIIKRRVKELNNLWLNVMICIKDILSHALIKKYPPQAKHIIPLFDTYTTKINWKY